MAENGVFLYYEGVLSISSTIFFYGVEWNAQRLRADALRAGTGPLTCQDDGLSGCISAESELPSIYQEQLAHSNLSISILSLTIFLARVTMRHLEKQPHRIYALYDVLNVLMWVFSLYQCIISQASSYSRSDNQASTCGIILVVLLVLLVGAGTHVSRLVIRIAEIYTRRNIDNDTRETTEYSTVDLEDGIQPWDQPLSPVLAFFPEDTRHYAK